MSVQQAIADNLADIMQKTGGSSVDNSLLSGRPKREPIAVPAATDLILETQQDIVKEFDNRIRSLAQQLEDVQLDVQMASVISTKNSAANNVQPLLLDAQQIASKTDSIGRQIERLNEDLKGKNFARFYDQQLSEQLWTRVSELRDKQMRVANQMEKTAAALDPASSGIAAQILELERARIQLQSDCQEAQQELEQLTRAEIENRRTRHLHGSKTAFSKLREQYQLQLTGLSGKLEAMNSIDKSSKEKLLTTVQKYNEILKPTYLELDKQMQELNQVGQILVRNILAKFPQNPNLSFPLQDDLNKIEAVSETVQRLSTYQFDSVAAVRSYFSEHYKLQILLNTLSNGGQTPLDRWYELLLKKMPPKSSPEVESWITKTRDVLKQTRAKCKSQMTTVEEKLDYGNKELLRLNQEVDLCERGHENQEHNCDNLCATLTCRFESDKNRLANDLRQLWDSQTSQLEQKLSECQRKNRSVLDGKLEVLKQKFNSLRYHIGGQVDLVTSAQNPQKEFLNQLSQLQPLNDEILLVEAQIVELRNAQQTVKGLKRKFDDLRDVYCRTLDVVNIIRPKSSSISHSSKQMGGMLDVEIEVDGVQTIDRPVNAEFATLKIRISDKQKSIILPINEDSSRAAAILPFPRVTSASSVEVTIMIDDKVVGYYQFPLEQISEENTWVEFPIAESSQSGLADHLLEPVMRIKIV